MVVTATLFVALVPPVDVTAPLAERVARLRTDLPGLAWVDPARWHVTVCFLGRADPRPALSAGLADVAARHPAPALSLGDAGHFGRRVLFAGVSGELASLAADTASAAAGAGYPIEDRAFHAHLTLARGRGRATDLRPAVQALSDLPRTRWVARDLLLMAGDQPGYRVVSTWQLAND